MKTIYKYEIVISDQLIKLKLTIGAKILYFQMQGMHPYIWVLLDLKMPIHQRTFGIVRTGHQVPDEFNSYIGTVQTQDAFTWHWHLFELR